MARSQESTTSLPDRFPVSKYSRWMDEEGQLLVVTGFYHGGAPGNLATREAVDLLNVHKERMGFVTMPTFISMVQTGQLMPWRAPEERPLF